MSEPVPRRFDDDLIAPIVGYVLDLLGLGLFGLILAYVKKGGAGEIARSHYVFQIRTLWIGLAWAGLGGVVFLIGVVLAIVLIGFAFIPVAHGIWALAGIWFIVRCVVGLIYALRGQPYPRPRAWLI
ncbi:MAG TPA: hypothetical protein VL358_06025 [Caulobacteraceae bacterium]|nr:hypothetical protein [Caulobacteraceae bacterium]